MADERNPKGVCVAVTIGYFSPLKFNDMKKAISVVGIMMDAFDDGDINIKWREGNC